MANIDGYLRSVPSDTNANDGRLYDPTQASGSVAYTLTCDVGAYAYTGVAANLTVARKLTLAVGAYTYTGVASTLTVARKLSLAAGAYAYTGQAAALTVGRRLALDVGAYAYAGLPAALAYTPGAGKINYVLALSAGAYAYAGSVSTLTYVSGISDQASNWQASYWAKSRRTKKEQELLTQAERVMLGILPPELDAIATSSVKDAHLASSELAANNVTAENALAVAMQARQAFEDAYVKAFKEVYTAEMISKAWVERMKAENNRRAALLLLLH